ncbi:hypothetical protein Taro_011093 [Colocasia esculenta]|uniref:NADH kinase n=1 Tax=Colocasia esculenta TaxID=4460 RepID=A0A843U4Y2_COLES|nr:hypothetical protein [Colocasia esculenta]
MSAFRRWRVLLVLKPFDVFPPRAAPELQEARSSFSAAAPSRCNNLKILRYLDDRCKVHKETIKFCQDVLQRRSLEWQPMLRNNLSEPIHDVDMVVTVGGDGTLLQASHFIDNRIPVLGVNSDPTQSKEVESFINEFDATRSTGYLCSARRENFEQVLDEILEGHKVPSEISRISVTLNDRTLPTFALNDILVAHPCPATVSRFSFSIKCQNQDPSSLLNCRSSGLRVSTAAGSTAAMLSAGGFSMPITSKDLQYMVREPISPKDMDTMHGLVKCNQSMHAMWYCKEGAIYVDGSHVIFQVQHGDTIEISSKAPTLKGKKCLHPQPRDGAPYPDPQPSRIPRERRPFESAELARARATLPTRRTHESTISTISLRLLNLLPRSRGRHHTSPSPMRGGLGRRRQHPP